MSVTMNTFQTVAVAPNGSVMAKVDAETGEVSIYPQGIGVGPQITMSKKDWVRIQREVMLAYMRAEGHTP